MNDNHAENDVLEYLLVIVLCAIVVALFFIAWVSIGVPVAKARDAGQWAGESPQVREWFESLTAPDTGISCCGEADGYPVKDWKTDGSNYFDVTLMDGRVFRVPAEKRQWREGNPTGLDILFIGLDGRTIYCFVVGAGI